MLIEEEFVKKKILTFFISFISLFNGLIQEILEMENLIISFLKLFLNSNSSLFKL